MFALDLTNLMNEEGEMKYLIQLITYIFTQAYPQKDNTHNALKMMDLVAEEGDIWCLCRKNINHQDISRVYKDGYRAMACALTA